MTLGRVRRVGFTGVALALVVLESTLRLAQGGPYVGATALLVAACGIALLSFVPSELAGPTVQLAVAPALGVGSFAILLTTVAILGVELSELSVRLTVATVVGACAVWRLVRPDREPRTRPFSLRREAAASAALLAIATFAFASSWDAIGPFPPPGADWGHYFLYAEEVEASGSLLLEDRLSGREGQLFADPPMIGALYGGALVLDGVSSRSLGPGLAVASALSTMAVVAAVACLWGSSAGLAAGAVHSVSAIRMDPMQWHGLTTVLAFVLLPLAVLAVGLMFRGSRGPRVVGLLGLALAGVAAAHPTTAVVCALFVAAVLVLDALLVTLVARPAPGRFPGRWWTDGVARPVLAGVAVAVVAGAGVGVHLLRQARDLGDPVDPRFLFPDWLTWRALDTYLSGTFLLLAGVAYLGIVVSRSTRRDPALLAVAALALASVAASQLWRIGVSFEYRRAVYPFGLVLVLLIGVAAARIKSRTALAVVAAVVCVYLGHQSIGLRLPERLLSEREPSSQASAALDALRAGMEHGRLPDARLVVTDQCLHFVVPYVLRRPTIAAFEEWQVGFESRVPRARTAQAILRGGEEGRRLAHALDVDYVVVDPRCTPDPAPGLDASAVVDDAEIVVLRVRT